MAFRTHSCPPDPERGNNLFPSCLHPLRLSYSEQPSQARRETAARQHAALLSLHSFTHSFIHSSSHRQPSPDTLPTIRSPSAHSFITCPPVFRTCPSREDTYISVVARDHRSPARPPSSQALASIFTQITWVADSVRLIPGRYFAAYQLRLLLLINSGPLPVQVGLVPFRRPHLAPITRLQFQWYILL